MNNYAEELYEKLKEHSDADCISIKDDIDNLVDLAKDAKEEYDDMDEKIDDAEDEVTRVEEEMGKSESLKISFDDWGLLGEQIADEVRDIMNNPKCNQIRFLDALKVYNQTITANKFKSAAI